jgi:hypothetical protein
MAKKLLEAQVDDGEDGQTNGVLQHYAYRYADAPTARGMPTRDTSHTHARMLANTLPTHRAITFAERFLTSNPPCLEQAGRWFHTGKSSSVCLDPRDAETWAVTHSLPSTRTHTHTQSQRSSS